MTERPSTPLFADEDGSPLMHSILDSLLKAALLHACGEAAAKIYTWHSAATRADVSNIQAAKSVSGAHRRPTDHRRERHRAAGPRRKRPLAAVPGYACKEFGGAGWGGNVLQRSKHSATDSRLPRRAMAEHTKTRASRSTDCGRCRRNNSPQKACFRGWNPS